MPLVHRIVKTFERSMANRLEYDDLVAIGTIALWRATVEYEPSRGTFMPFAWACIRRALLSEKQDSRRKKIIPPRKTQSVDVTDDGSEPLQLRARCEDADELLDRARANRQIRLAVVTLPVNLRAVIESRADGETLETIGERVGITREAVRLREKTAMRMIREKIGVGS